MDERAKQLRQELVEEIRALARMAGEAPNIRAEWLLTVVAERLSDIEERLERIESHLVL